MARMPDIDDLDFWPHVYRETMRDARLIGQQRDRVRNEDLRAALWHGRFQLYKKADEALQWAVKHGQLLRCY